jgi:hypothetical protein
MGERERYVSPISLLDHCCSVVGSEALSDFRKLMGAVAIGWVIYLRLPSAATTPPLHLLPLSLVFYSPAHFLLLHNELVLVFIQLHIIPACLNSLWCLPYTSVPSVIVSRKNVRDD